VIADRVRAHRHLEPRRVGLGIDGVGAPEPPPLHRDALGRREIDDHRRVLGHGAPAIDGDRDRQRALHAGRELDALRHAHLPIVTRSLARLRAGRRHHHEHGGDDELHRICVASSASGERSPFVRIT
jgi:hypothetical protein